MNILDENGQSNYHLNPSQLSVYNSSGSFNEKYELWRTQALYRNKFFINAPDNLPLNVYSYSIFDSSYFSDYFFNEYSKDKGFNVFFLVREKHLKENIEFLSLDETKESKITAVMSNKPKVINFTNKISGPAEETKTSLTVHGSESGYILIEVSEYSYNEDSLEDTFPTTQIAFLDLSESNSIYISNRFFNYFFDTNSLKVTYVGTGEIDINISKSVVGSKKVNLPTHVSTALDLLDYGYFFCRKRNVV